MIRNSDRFGALALICPASSTHGMYASHIAPPRGNILHRVQALPTCKQFVYHFTMIQYMQAGRQAMLCWPDGMLQASPL